MISRSASEAESTGAASRRRSLSEILDPIRPELDQVADRIIEDLRPEESDLSPLVDLAAGYRGKQLRPALVLLAGAAVGETSAVHVTLGEIVEMLHTATLVHDDVLDGAMLRRGQATLNAMHGADIPVLLGDYVYAKAFHLSVGLEDPTCSRVLAEATRRICQGEITQILHRFDFEWTEERYEQVILEKTALLYGASSRLGAHYAGGTEEQVEAMDLYGRELGIAFQIVDDCLDLDGDEEVVGKSLGTDLQSGKLTLPLLRLMRDPDQAKRLRALMETDDDAKTKLTRLRSEFPLNAALAESYATAEQRLQNARNALADFRPSPAKDALDAIAEYVQLRRR